MFPPTAPVAKPDPVPRKLPIAKPSPAPAGPPKTNPTKQERSFILGGRPHFTSFASWNEYAKENGLPSAGTFVRHFGNWNEVKKYLDLPIDILKSKHYTKEMIDEVLREHGKKSDFSKTI
ncbi:hypothetical protein CVD28_11690 [Bacillus sp. M6-12]|nr:hypothetical protein CVD28_11690 [Bacillus sp. M6-12]